MKTGFVLGIMVVTILITLYEWPKINAKQKKEKIAFAIFTAIGFVLANLLVFFPNMKGPDNLIDVVFKPIYNPLKKFIEP